MRESVIVTAITTYLQWMENLGKLVFIRNNSGAFINPKGNFFKMGRAGSPDFIVFLNNGRTIHLEIKNEKGKQNQAQKDYEEKVTKLGHSYFLARDVNQVEEILN